MSIILTKRIPKSNNNYYFKVFKKQINKIILCKKDLTSIANSLLYISHGANKKFLKKHIIEEMNEIYYLTGKYITFRDFYIEANLEIEIDDYEIKQIILVIEEAMREIDHEGDIQTLTNCSSKELKKIIKKLKSI
jgi:hypothetical protein